MAGRIDAGMVWMNSSNDSDYRVPKQVGIGRELGETGLDVHTTVKAVQVLCKLDGQTVRSEGALRCRILLQCILSLPLSVSF